MIIWLSGLGLYCCLPPKDLKKIAFHFSTLDISERIFKSVSVSNGKYACSACTSPVLLPLSDRTKVSTHYWYVVQDTKGYMYWFTWLQLLNLVCYIVMSGYWNVLHVIVIIHYKAYLTRLCRCYFCSINISTMWNRYLF